MKPSIQNHVVLYAGIGAVCLGLATAKRQDMGGAAVGYLASERTGFITAVLLLVVGGAVKPL